jgi:cytochrome oxidase Cu insertion factor (SCO1/SenC/PrrC family)
MAWQRSSPLARTALLLAAVALVATACGGDGDEAQAQTQDPAPELAAQPAPADQALVSDLLGPEETFLHRPSDRQAPGFTLIDQNGDSVSLSDFAGKWILVDWVYTKCLTVCPLLTSEMGMVRNGLGDAVGEDVQFLSITFDSEVDTPEALKDHAMRTGSDVSGWSWLTGPKEDTDAVAASYGVSYDPAAAIGGIPQFDHTALMVIIDPNGRERHRYLGSGWAADVLDRLNVADTQSDAGTVALPEPEPVAADEPTAAVANLSAETSDVLAAAIGLTWEDWELEDGVSSQILYQFPSTGQKNAFVDQMRKEAAEQGITIQSDKLSAMNYDLIDWGDGRITAVAYTDGNIALVVEGAVAKDIRTALAVVDDEWCCSAPE